MQMVGFVLFVIGIFIALFAKRVVLSRISLEEKDRKELELLASGAVLAVRLAGVVVTVVGILFLAM